MTTRMQPGRWAVRLTAGRHSQSQPGRAPHNHTRSHRASTTGGPMPQDTLLLYDDPSSGRKVSPDEMQTAIEKYRAWMKKPFTGDSKRLAGDPGPSSATRRGAARTDGPYSESKEVLGGYLSSRPPATRRPSPGAGLTRTSSTAEPSSSGRCTRSDRHPRSERARRAPLPAPGGPDRGPLTRLLGPAHLDPRRGDGPGALIRALQTWP